MINFSSRDSKKDAERWQKDQLWFIQNTQQNAENLEK